MSVSERAGDGARAGRRDQALPGQPAGARPRRRRPHGHGRRVRRHRRAVRVGQVDADEHRRRAAAADGGHRAHRRPRRQLAARRPAGGRPRPAHRVRVPAVPPRRGADGAGERRRRPALRRCAPPRADEPGPGRARGGRAGRAGDHRPGASCRAASASGSPSPARSSATRRSCSPTSRPATSTAAPARPSSACSSTSTPSGRTIVLITHDREIAARAPRRVALLDGRVVDDTAGAAA